MNNAHTITINGEEKDITIHWSLATRNTVKSRIKVMSCDTEANFHRDDLREAAVAAGVIAFEHSNDDIDFQNMTFMKSNTTFVLANSYGKAITVYIHPAGYNAKAQAQHDEFMARIQAESDNFERMKNEALAHAKSLMNNNPGMRITALEVEVEGNVFLVERQKAWANDTEDRYNVRELTRFNYETVYPSNAERELAAFDMSVMV